MRLDPAPRNSPCWALLDDMSGGAARSRLYTRHAATLSLTSAAALADLMEHTEAALARGLHAVGLFTYELGANLQGIAQGGDRPPLAQVLLFEECRKLGEDQVASWLEERCRSAIAGVADVRASVSEQEFERSVRRILDYIAAGDCYQVNYTYRLDFLAYGDPESLYARLRQRQRVPYGALIELPDAGAVLSLSPELFVRHASGELVAQPMKGTARAVADDGENRRIALALAADPKNRAENLMIVDLLRNDLGRIAKTGSVRVPSLFDVSRFGEVLQMTSTVRAELQDGCSLADVFRALFPCGSITGAPKRRSMQLIDELEGGERGIYTGGIAWFDAPASPGGVPDFCMSVPIRTLVLEPPRDGVRAGRMGVGSGIVSDSRPAAEFAECRLKAGFLTGLPSEFELIETVHATRAAGCRHLQRHLLRLAGSARFFGFPLDMSRVTQALLDACDALEDDGAWRLRLALRCDGTWSLQKSRLNPLAGAVVRVLVSEAPIIAADLFNRHKTSIRGVLDAAWRDAEARGAFDTLLFNERGELAQGGRSNVFLKLHGRWFTPPLNSGALPGVMRSVLLDDPAWAATENVLTRTDLHRCEEIVVCNALRGVVHAELHATGMADCQKATLDEQRSSAALGQLRAGAATLPWTGDRAG